MEEKKVLDVYPITKSQRILVWICEAIVTFALAFILMHAAVTPLYSLIGGYAKIQEDADTAIRQRNRLLLENKLIYFENDEDQIGDISYGLEYTYSLFMGDFIKAEEGHNVFKEFYDKFDNSDENYYDMFKTYDAELHLFNFDDSSKTITLKDEYKTKFNAVVDKTDEMSSDAQRIYEKYCNKVFLTFYSHIMRQMEAQDTNLSGVSYIKLSKRIETSTKFYDRMMIIGAFVSYVVSWAVTSILIPLVNRNRRSLSMIMMRIQRVTLSEFKILKAPRLLLVGFYQLITYLFMTFLIPMPLISFAYIFSLPILIYPSLISAIVCIFSFVTILINGANQSTTDLLSSTFFVTNDTLDDIYRAKGYTI